MSRLSIRHSIRRLCWDPCNKKESKASWAEKGRPLWVKRTMWSFTTKCRLRSRHGESKLCLKSLRLRKNVGDLDPLIFPRGPTESSHNLGTGPYERNVEGLVFYLRGGNLRWKITNIICTYIHGTEMPCQCSCSEFSKAVPMGSSGSRTQLCKRRTLNPRIAAWDDYSLIFLNRTTFGDPRIYATQQIGTLWYIHR